jgi:hypothetical protein
LLVHVFWFASKLAAADPVRPFAETQTRRASGARACIVAGANGRVSGTEGFSG